MASLFKAKNHTEDANPHEQLTRFKKWHVRDVPQAKPDTGIDPHENLTRMDRQHARVKPASMPGITAIARPHKRTRTDIAADLHATDPISIDVLRRALPLRCAKIQA